MKTKIRKFLWFDITPRKELYNEINDCYQFINELKNDICERDNEIISLNRRIEHLDYALERLERINTELQYGEEADQLISY